METSERAEGGGNNEGTGQQDGTRCGICHGLACEPVIADKCCNQVFCSKCLQKYLKDTEDNHDMPCPCCKKEHFTYMQLKLIAKVS